MNIKKILTSSLIGVFAIAISVGVAAASSHFISPSPFTAAELSTNWGADRTFPTGGVTSVTAFGRNDVARIGIDSSLTASGGFYRTEGIKTLGADNFGTAVEVDLYIDPAWEENAVRAGFWVVGDESGARTANFGVVEFVNSENCAAVEDCSTHISNRPDHEGFRIFDGVTGWTNVATAFEYGEWVTLGIELDTVAGEYIYFINGEEVGTASGGGSFIRELFLNNYNYGLDNFPTLNSDSYAAHWNVDIVVGPPVHRAQCKNNGWQTFNNPSFSNQGKCLKYVNENFDKEIEGNLEYTAYGLERVVDFRMNVADNKGKFTYKDADKGSYKVDVSETNAEGNETGWFAGKVTKASNPSWVGLWLFAKVQEQEGPDLIWGSFTDEATAVSGVKSKGTPVDGPFTVTRGDVEVDE